MIELTADGLGLRLGVHVEVAVVVVADVLLVKDRNSAHGAFGRLFVPHVPVGNEVEPVGVGRHGQENDVVEDAPGLGVVRADHPPDELDELLGAEDLRRVETAVDPDNGLALGGEAARVGFAYAFGQSQACRDVLVAGQPTVVRRAR